MLIELHIIQNFAPSNLNRDDTGSPKDCEFGGVRRARISSQSLKRRVRDMVRGDDERRGLLRPGHPEYQAQRTKRLVDEVTERLVELGRDQEEARAAIRGALRSLGFDFDARHPDQTQYLIFLGNDEIQRLTEAVDAHRTTLAQSKEAAEVAAVAGGGRAPRVQSGAKNVPDDVKKALDAVFHTAGPAADLAMYGRMLANVPAKNVDAASQVAHAISTHRVNLEFDYFTAVDDLKRREEDAGAGYLDTVQFNSACYYRYSNVAVNQLQKNLGGDIALARDALKAFLEATILSLPDAKQNSFAAQNHPAFILSVVRDRRQPASLANAFERAIPPTDRESLTGQSVTALIQAFERYESMYADYTGLVARFACGAGYTEPPYIQGLADAVVPRVRDLVERTVTAALP
ncbi:MAG TPA: type I-E CRISPR-associated protein Cas7/Cse4/CasC [Dehalococcoidia bacterium]|nr:type I-E CRISPR-associated protein Cas7/Cse4/CasC [Dehalococcoidia bacterium]